MRSSFGGVPFEKLEKFLLTYHLSLITYHLSLIIYHSSFITYHSLIIYHSSLNASVGGIRLILRAGM